MHRCVLLATLIAAIQAVGQQCPQMSPTGPSISSQPLTLEGQLVYHDGIRKWFELKLDQPQCGQTSTELVRVTPGHNPLPVLRGCRVRSTGNMDFSPTGYYSLDTFQDVQAIEAIGDCVRQPPFAEDPKGKPDQAVRAYRVDMNVIYDGEHPIRFRVSSGGKELKPWQAYASYLFTGGFVLYGYCGSGFVVDKVFGTPQAGPSHFDEPRTSGDAAMFDPEGAAMSGNKAMHLVYTCVRDPASVR